MKTGTLIRIGLSLAAAAAFLPMPAAADGQPAPAASAKATVGQRMYNAIMDKDLAALKACLAEDAANMYRFLDEAPFEYRDPLLLCAKQRWMEGLQCLVEAGADVNRAVCYDNTALLVCISENWPEGVDYLLSHGADPNIPRGSVLEAAPLHRAVYSRNNERIVRALLAAGADPNLPSGDGKRPALHFCRTRYIPLLLEAGADPNGRSEHGLTPLMCVTGPEAARLLLAAGADPHATCPNDDFGEPAVTTLVSYAPADAEVLEVLLEAGARDGRLLGFQWIDREMDDEQKAVIAKWQASSPLMKAALAGDTPQMQTLLTEGADAAFADNGGVTPLMYAAGSGKADGVELLLKAGAKAAPADMNQDTALHYAAAKGCADAARLLLAAGADANAKDTDGWTPLAVAIFKGNAPVVEALLQGGADADITLWEKTTCRELAFRYDSYNIVPILLFLEAEPAWGEGSFSHGYPHIWGAGSPDIRRMLLQQDNGRISEAELDFLMRQAKDSEECRNLLKTALDKAQSAHDTNTLNSALRLAIELDSLPMAEDILRRGGSPDAILALEITKSEGMCRLLLKAGANPNLEAYEEKPIFRAAGSFGKGSLKPLLEAGVDPDTRNEKGQTPLMCAEPDAIPLLLAAGADPNAVDNIGWTVLAHQIQKMYDAHHDAAVWALMAAGAEIDQARRDSYGRTLLHVAVFHAGDKLLRTIIDAGMDVDARDEDGRTPLMNASAAAARILLEAGADPTLKDNDGRSVLDHARDYGGLPRWTIEELRWLENEMESRKK